MALRQATTANDRRVRQRIITASRFLGIGKGGRQTQPTRRGHANAILWAGSLLLAMISPTGAHAVDCTFGGVLKEAQAEIIHRLDEVGDAQKNIAQEMEGILEKAKSGDKPLVTQLPGSEIAKLEVLRTKLSALGMSSVVIGDRERDLRLAYEMYQVAKAVKTGTKAGAGNEDGATVLVFMRERVPNASIETPKERGGCSSDVLLFAEQEAAYADAASIAAGVGDPLAQLKGILAKYGYSDTSPSVDPSRFSAEDLARLDTLEAALTRYEGDREYQKNLGMLRLWLATSDLVFDGRQRDLVTFPGDTQRIGQDIDRQYANLSKRQRELLQIWQSVNQVVKSEVLKNFDDAARIQNKAKH